ncbi:MAG: triple tyrosine motif-containing protein [Bacteroidetes bacterium]|nr:triple tyrosine motif-containing protein [Bacteroidota bacterium]
MRIIAILFLTVTLQLGAQDFTVKQYLVKDGLSANLIECLGQDSTGFIWVGAKNGLNKFDGKKFQKGRIVALDKSFVYSKGIFAFCLDKKGNFWAGTDGLGLVKYNYEKDVFEQLSVFTDPDINIERKVILNVNEDKAGNLWVTTPHAVGVFNPVENKIIWHHDFTKAVNKEIAYCSTLHIDKQGNKWLGLKKGAGLFKYDDQARAFAQFTFTIANAPGLKLNIKDIEQINDSTLALANEGEGLVLLNINTSQAYRLSHIAGDVFSLSANFVFSLHSRNDSTLLVGTINGGLQEFNTTTKLFHSVSLVPNANENGKISISGFWKDDQGNIWLGTHNEGIFIIKNYPPGIVSVSHSTSSGLVLCDKPVSAFCRDKANRIWATVDGCGVNCYNPATKTWKNYNISNGLKSNAVEAIQELPDGTLWMATWGGGVDVFDPATGKFTNYSPDVPGTVSHYNLKSLFFDGTYLWIGTYGDGVNIYDFKNKQFITSNSNGKAPFNLKTPLWINNIFKDSKGFLWISTSTGLFMYDKKKLYSFFNDPTKKNSIISNYSACVSEDLYHGLWVGTMEGLCLYNYTSRSFIANNQPLLKGSIKGITSDRNGLLWISVNSNVVQYDSQKDSVMALLQSVNLDMPTYTENGVFFDKTTGDLYFGNSKGYTTVNPDFIKTDTRGLKIIFTSLTINNSEIDPFLEDENGLDKQLHLASSFVLEPDQNNFAIDFTVLDPSNRNQYLYLYKLEGFDNNWQNAGDESKAFYTNLAPGTYTFSVKATNMAGQEILTSKKIEIKILPHWYQALWFKITGIALLVILFFGIIEWRTRKLKKQYSKIP